MSAQAALLEVIADDMQDRATGVLLITHDRVLAEQWCDRIVELPALPLAGGPRRHQRRAGPVAR